MIDQNSFKLHCEYLSLTDLKPYQEILEKVLKKKLRQNKRTQEQHERESQCQ